MPKLRYTDAEGAPAEHVVSDAPVTIGRSAECDIRLAGADVARLHAVVEASGTKLRVRDQESREGTWVGDEKVTDALLGNGDEFRIGGVSFEVSLGGGGVGGGGSSRRSARSGEGEGKDGAEGKGSRRAFQRPRREILGGVRLSKTQQTIVKIVCAVVILFCIAVMIGLINYWQNRPVEYSSTENRNIYVDQEGKPKRLSKEARELARSAREAEQAGRTREAYKLFTEAKEKAEEARTLITELAEKHSGPTYWKLHSTAGEIANQATTISSEAFRLEMQVQRDDAGGG